MNNNYDNDWLLNNWENYRNWKSLCDAYNEKFGTNFKYNTFKSHCNRGLKLNFHYTKEQEEWLLENYPKLGRNKCADEFNKLFNTNRTANGIRIHCTRLGLHVSDERRRLRAIENTGNCHDVGSIVKKAHGYLFIKKPNGEWEQLQRYIYKNKISELPKDYIVIFKDGNKQNLSEDNLMAVPKKYASLMTKNEFWSKSSEITETGIIWCELYCALKEGVNKYGQTEIIRQES